MDASMMNADTREAIMMDASITGVIPQASRRGTYRITTLTFLFISPRTRGNWRRASALVFLECDELGKWVYAVILSSDGVRVPGFGRGLHLHR